MNNQRSETGKISLIEEGKKIGIDEVIKRNEIIKKGLKCFKHKSMSSYSLKCRKNTESINPKVSKTNNDKTMISKCEIYGRKKSFIKKYEASVILIDLGLKTPLNKILLLGDTLFRNQFHLMQFH